MRARTGLLAVALACACLSVADSADAVDLQHWGAPDINASEAWSLSTGAGVDVAVVDTGVMANHEELLGRIAAGGWGFDGSTDDTFGHGTAVAGVIAADPSNGKGIAGVAPDAKIVPFRAFADDSSPDPALIVEGLDRAADSGAPIVNASFSTEPYRRPIPDDFNAIEAVFAAHPGTLFVTAAGNDGNDNDEFPTLPCNANASNVICVGAYTPSHKPWEETNYGETSVDVLAPGVPIYSSTVGGGYDYFSGTSMAAAFISGEAALLYARIPGLTPEEAINLILSTTNPVAAFASKAASPGRPDAYQALEAGIADQDHDGVYDVVDRCPSEPNATPDGCAAVTQPPTSTPAPTTTPKVVPTVVPTPEPTATPQPEPLPQVRSLTAKVTRCKGGRSCKKSATVKLTPDRTAQVNLRVDRRVCDTRKRCHWSRYTTKAFSASTRGKSVIVRGKRAASLPRGTYRVVAVLSTRAGAGKPATKTFQVH